MPQLFIHVTNGKFRSRDEGADYDDPTAALALGVRSAFAIAAEEVARGERSAAVDICIEQEDGTLVLRSVVAVSISPLSLALGPI